MGASQSRNMRLFAAMTLLPSHHAALVRSLRTLAPPQLAAASLRPAVLRSRGAVSLSAAPAPLGGGAGSSVTARRLSDPSTRAASTAAHDAPLPPSPPSSAPHAEASAREPHAEVSARAATEAHVVLDRASARSAAAILAQHNHLVHACDTEVAGLDLSKSPLGQGEVICISVYSGPEIDFGSGRGRALWVDTTEEGVLDEFKAWLEDESALKVWHNYGFDRHVLYNHDVNVRGFGGDTMHMARLWDASRLAGYSLEVLTDELLGRRKVPMKELFGVPKLKNDGTPGKTILMPPVDDLQTNPLSRPEWIQYSCYDAQGTWELYQNLASKLRDMRWEGETRTESHAESPAEFQCPPP